MISWYMISIEPKKPMKTTKSAEISSKNATAEISSNTTTNPSAKTHENPYAFPPILLLLPLRKPVENLCIWLISILQHCHCSLPNIAKHQRKTLCSITQACGELMVEARAPEKWPSKSKKKRCSVTQACGKLMVEAWATFCNKICPIILDIYVVNK